MYVGFERQILKMFELIFFRLILELTFVWSSNDPLTPVLIPVVNTTYLGGDIRFICAKPDPSMEIAWNTPLLPIFKFETNNQNTSNFVSSVPSVSFNNTLVSCIGRLPTEPSRLYYSNSGKIVLQGFLSEINPTINKLNPCTVEISWDAPFTLVDVPIIGYNVNITDLDSNTETYFFTNNTYFKILLGYDYIVSIAGVNGAGEGNISVIDINSAVLPQEKTFDVNTDEISRNGNIWEIDVTVDSALLCQNSASNSRIFFNFCLKDATESCFNTSDVSQINRTELSATVPLLENQQYNYTVIHVIGNTFVTSNETKISTFDVQSIENFNRNLSNGSICLNINYVTGSVATGCLIKITCGSYFLPNFSINGYDKLFHRFWCSPNLINTIRNTTVCSLEVYDKVNDTVEDQSDPAVELLVTITISSEIMASSVIDDMSTPTPSLNTSSSAIIISAYAIAATLCLIAIIVTLFLIVIIAMVFLKKKFQVTLPEMEMQTSETTDEPNNVVEDSTCHEDFRYETYGSENVDSAESRRSISSCKSDDVLLSQ